MALYEDTLKALRAREDSLNKDGFAATTLIRTLNKIAEFKVKNNGELYEITFKDNYQFLTGTMETSEVLRAIVDHAKEKNKKSTSK
ncbi:hypothetical protein [Streptococcus intermedius]